jgi:hypothetical protein
MLNVLSTNPNEPSKVKTWHSSFLTSYLLEVCYYRGWCRLPLGHFFLFILIYVDVVPATTAVRFRLYTVQYIGALHSSKRIQLRLKLRRPLVSMPKTGPTVRARESTQVEAKRNDASASLAARLQQLASSPCDLGSASLL